MAVSRRNYGDGHAATRGFWRNANKVCAALTLGFFLSAGFFVHSIQARDSYRSDNPFIPSDCDRACLYVRRSIFSGAGGEGSGARAMGEDGEVQRE